MLRSIENDLVHLLGILNSIAKIRIYSDEYTSPEEFYKADNQLNFNACLNLLANTGECANKLSDELKFKHSKIEWSKIISFRNRIVHDYTGIEVFIIFETIKKSLVELEKEIFRIVEVEMQGGSFNKEEYIAAKGSEFYKFIDFSKITF